MKIKGGKKRKKHTVKIQVGCSSKKKSFRGGKGMAEFSPMTLPKVPNALIGPPWSPSAANSNHYAHNLYKTDIVTTMKNPGSQQNFDYRWGKMWGGKKSKGRKYGQSINKSRKYGKQMKGGAINSFVPSDLLNAGRYLGYNVQNTWNGYFGYPPAVNPLPWVQSNLQ